MKQAYLRDIFKKAYECSYIKHCGISWPLVFYLSTSSFMKSPEKREVNPDHPEPADEWNIQMEYSSY